MNDLERLIVKHDAAILFVDPLAELHGENENDNTGMRAILAAFRNLAARLNIAVVVVHHTRKGPVTAGDPDAGRGASAISAASRVVLTITNMTIEKKRPSACR
jgi:RecA-family ATPase